MRLKTLLATLAVALGSQAAGAADLFAEEPAQILRTETFTAEVFTGYLMGKARETVYDVANNGAKVSQLEWNTNALALGGRIAVRPLDWLTFRFRGWSTVMGEGDMTDYDFLGGYYGPKSWTHRSYSPNTNATKAWQADASAAATLYADGDLSLSGIAGYRYFTQKWNAKGGSYIYSVDSFRDAYGVFPGNQVGIAYQQWWQTPYLGVGATYSAGDWSVSAEAIGSPFVMAEDKDYHALRQLLFREKFGLSGMVGLSGSVEYRITPMLALAGRVEYQNYLGARGGTRTFDGATGLSSEYLKPSAGAYAETLMLSVGVKARL